MTTPTGTIAMTDIQTEFGGANPISLDEYYAGAGYVSAAVAGVPTSGTISMNDLRGKTQPNFGALTPSINPVTEGGASVTFTLSGGSGIVDGTYYWKVSGTNITAGDFTAITGSFTITSNTGSFVVTAVSDALIEGTETFTASIGIASGVPVSYVNSAPVNLVESVTYGWGLQPTTPANEGSVLSFAVATSNVPAGTLLYYTIGVVSGTVNSSDFSSAVSGAMSAVVITSSPIGSCSGSLTISNDLLTEGVESFNIQIHTGSIAGPVVLTSTTVTIIDTSLSPPTYSASWSSPTIYDGSAVALVVNTTSVPDGTVLYYPTVGTMSSSDMPMISGSTLTINSNNSTVYHYKRFDGGTDAGKTLIVNVRTGSTAGPIVAGTGTLTSADAIGVVNTASKTGEQTSIGVTTQIQVIISNINAYFEDRYFQIWRTITSPIFDDAYTGVTCYVPAYATNSAWTTAYGPVTTTSGPYTMQVRLVCAGHATYYFAATTVYL